MDAPVVMARMLRAARLDRLLYEEVEADATALPQAMLVVVLSSVAAAIGVSGRGSLGFVLLNALLTLLLWYLWAFLIYWIGTHLLPEPETRADHGELLRVLGFAATPGILRVFGIVTPIAVPVLVVTSVWTLATSVVAVRQALDYRSTTRAIGVCAIGWVIMSVLIALLQG